MKTKKTIRKMAHTPLARDLAKLQRSLEFRLDRLVQFADEVEQERRALRRENDELFNRLRSHAQGVGESGSKKAPVVDGYDLFPPWKDNTGPCGAIPSGACYLGNCKQRDTCEALVVSNGM